MKESLMKRPTLVRLSGRVASKYVTLLFLLFLTASIAYHFSARSQTRPRTTGQSGGDKDSVPSEVVKVDVDLVTVDALVMQKQTARVVGNLTRDDFVLSEDGVKQIITHFSQDSLPLSVLLLIDRGG